MLLPLISKAILQTIIYADVFDYPLTLNEIWTRLIKVKSQKSKVKTAIQNLRLIRKGNGYYFLENRDNIVNLRKKKEEWSEEKLKIAQDIGGLLKIIPTVKLVGVTGALAVRNVQKEDDIDLFVITSAGLLWTTRLLATLIVELTGMRRHPKEESVNNKICLNMFVDSDHLQIPKRDQDLFSAHEVVQMKLLWERNETYRKFLIANQWVKKFLPNAYNIRHGLNINQDTDTNSWTNTAVRQYLSIFHFSIVEDTLKRLQLWYMRNRRTSEVIKDGIIRFHPQDARKWVMREYKKRIKHLGVMLY